MAIPKSIPKFLLNQTAYYQEQIETPYGLDWGEKKPIQCRFEPSHKLIASPQANDAFGGQDIVAAAIMFSEPGTDLPLNTRVEHNGKTYTVIESAEYPGPTGEIHHVETALR